MTMQKYLSCPLCGTPEPDIILNESDNGTEILVFRCTKCLTVIKMEDITEEYNMEAE